MISTAFSSDGTQSHCMLPEKCRIFRKRFHALFMLPCCLLDSLFRIFKSVYINSRIFHFQTTDDRLHLYIEPYFSSCRWSTMRFLLRQLYSLRIGEQKYHVHDNPVVSRSERRNAKCSSIQLVYGLVDVA